MPTLRRWPLSFCKAEGLIHTRLREQSREVSCTGDAGSFSRRGVALEGARQGAAYGRGHPTCHGNPLTFAESFTPVVGRKVLTTFLLSQAATLLGHTAQN
jgi:hypothetical protein